MHSEIPHQNDSSGGGPAARSRRRHGDGDRRACATPPGGLLLELTLPNGRNMLPGVPNAQNTGARSEGGLMSPRRCGVAARLQPNDLYGSGSAIRPRSPNHGARTVISRSALTHRGSASEATEARSRRARGRPAAGQQVNACTGRPAMMQRCPMEICGPSRSTTQEASTRRGIYIGETCRAGTRSTRCSTGLGRRGEGDTCDRDHRNQQT